MGSALTIVGLIVAIFYSAGWIMAAVGVLLLAGSAVFAALSAERAKEAASKAWAIREYKSRLDEIDSLVGELHRLATPERLSERGAADMRKRLDELKSKKEQILASLLELDRYLKDPKNRPMALERERRDLELKIDKAPAEVKATFEQNLEAVTKTEQLLETVKKDRETLVANLDKILYGLRSTRAQLVAEVSHEQAGTGQELANQMSSSIQDDITDITSSIKAVDGMRSEIEDLTQDRAKKAAQRQPS